MQRGEPTPRRYQFRLLNKQGQVRWVENFSVPTDWEGRPSELNFLTDITDRKLAEGELDRHRDHLNEMVREWQDELKAAGRELHRTIIDRWQAEEDLRIRDLALKSAVNAISLADLHGDLVYVNPAWLKLWGIRDEADALGRSMYAFWEDRQEVAAVSRALETRGAWEGEMTGRRLDGTVFIGLLSANTVRDETGRPVCTMAWYLDVTEQRPPQAAAPGLPGPTPVPGLGTGRHPIPGAPADRRRTARPDRPDPLPVEDESWNAFRIRSGRGRPLPAVGGSHPRDQTGHRRVA